jgi:lipopolysaccharide transport system ATP-binding protein
MSDVVIRAEGIGKRFRIGRQQLYRTVRESLASAFLAPFRRSGNGSPHEPRGPETFWALQDVGFEVNRGEAIAVIGLNGAGKSTLLKILSRITEPTTGRVDIHGRLSSLLEVGTGFHSELSGRENIYLNGAILGMRRAEISRKFDEMVAFAEVERFIDTPVKHYSSGMYMRLAFAVAAHLETEILVVDEVLAVGDAQFQKKCLGKMGEVARAGRTVLFVSHNMSAVQGLCTRALWLDSGRLRETGEVSRIVSDYLLHAVTQCTERSWPDLESAPGGEHVRLRNVRVRPVGGDPSGSIRLSTPCEFEFLYWNLKPGARLNLSVAVFNETGTCVFTTTTVSDPNWHGRAFPTGLFSSTCLVPGNLLNSGLYRVNLLVVQDGARVLYRHEDLIVFEVHDEPDARSTWFGKWPGAVRPELDWRTDLLQDAPAEAASATD